MHNNLSRNILNKTTSRNIVQPAYHQQFAFTKYPKSASLHVKIPLGSRMPKRSLDFFWRFHEHGYLAVLSFRQCLTQSSLSRSPGISPRNPPLHIVVRRDIQRPQRRQLLLLRCPLRPTFQPPINKSVILPRASQAHKFQLLNAHHHGERIRPTAVSLSPAIFTPRIPRRCHKLPLPWRIRVMTLPAQIQRCRACASAERTDVNSRIPFLTFLTKHIVEKTAEYLSF